MPRCKECSSYAINHHCYGRDGSDGDLCDVCYWRKRAEPASPWVAVSERIPPFEEKVLLKFSNGHIEDATFYPCEGGWVYTLFDGESLTVEPVEWMPLPPAPELGK